MWSSFTDAAKQSFKEALDKTSDALEKTGDALTQAAVQARHSSVAKMDVEAAAAAVVGGDDAASNDNNKKGDDDGNKANSDNDNAATATATPTSPSNMLSSFGTMTTNFQAPNPANFSWNSVVESTKAFFEKAQQVVHDSQVKFQKEYQKAQQLAEQQARQAQLRDLSLPLDTLALQDTHVVYMTNRIITCSHPAMASASDGDITPPRKLAALGHLLQKRHAGRFMIWNLSEVEYDDAAALYFQNQVLNYSFPGSPSPPLGLLLKLLTSLESWLRADEQNVVVIHCLTGKGRTSLVVAAFLGWMAEAGFGDITEALNYIAKCKQIPPQELTIPSQRRYANYFTNMLEDSIRPSQPPLLITRVILSQPPRFARGPGRSVVAKNGGGETKDGEPDNDNKDSSSSSWKEEDFWGCAPYLQLFKGGQLVFTAPASKSYAVEEEEAKKAQEEANNEGDKKQETPSKAKTTKTPSPKASTQKEALPFCHAGDGSVSFHVNQIVQGDVLLRCRHLTAKRQRVSMFRAAFHTGYMGNNNVLRLTKAQLDGACNDHDRFADDFYVDVLLEPVDSEEAGKLLKKQQDIPTPEQTEEVVDGKANDKKKTTTVTATAYDTMLDRDSRFWDVIDKRRQAQKEKEAAAKEQDGAAAAEAPAQAADPNWGPTVGRRRLWGAPEGGKAAKTASSGSGSGGEETFSIGGDMDFLPQENEAPEEKKKEPKKTRDSLLEALTGAIDDDDEAGGEEDDEHEVVFFQQEQPQSQETTQQDGNTETDSASVAKTEPAVDATPTTAAPADGTTSSNNNSNAPSVASSSQQDSAVVVDAMDATPPDEDLLITANLTLDDDDMNALLGGGADDDLDADLEDLENLLAQK